MSAPMLRASTRSPRSISPPMSATARASACAVAPRMQAGDPHQPRIVDDLEARRRGGDQPRALPFLEPPADRLAADVELVGDLRLRQLSRKAHPVRGGDAEVGGIFDEPVGEHDVGILVALAVLRPDRVEQPARREPQEARADRRVEIEERGEVGPRNADHARRRQRPRRGDARRPSSGRARRSSSSASPKMSPLTTRAKRSARLAPSCASRICTSGSPPCSFAGASRKTLSAASPGSKIIWPAVTARGRDAAPDRRRRRATSGIRGLESRA